MSEAFVYLWRNAKTNKFYIGSHRGTIDDGYSHSSYELPDFSRCSSVIPDHYSRRILAYGTELEMWRLERKLQLNRKAKCWNRYYNGCVCNEGRELPPIKWLHECFELDADTGTLTWKTRPATHFTSARYQKATNSRCAGKKAGKINDQGYCRLSFTWEGKTSNYFEHRIVWAMHYRQCPTKALDHIDGDKTNNAITNLREVTKEENSKNRGLHKNNTTGHVGVVWESRRSKWAAQIGIKGKMIRLGRYINIEDAIAARQAAEIKYGFHENHGRS